MLIRVELAHKTQVQGDRIVRISGRIDRRGGSCRVAIPLESGQPPSLRLKRIDRKVFEIAAAWMRHMIATSGYGTAAPGVVDVDGQGHVWSNRGMEA